MANAVAKAKDLIYTVQEYFALEATVVDAKYEFFDGVVYAMAGAQPDHNSVCANLITTLTNTIRRRKKPCRVFTSDQRIRSEHKQSGQLGYFYPDVSVVCGKPEFSNDTPQTLLNATLIIEVLSESTYHHDFYRKRMFYAAQPSVKEMLFINYEAASVLGLFRSGENWQIADYQLLKEKVALNSIGIDLAMKEIYRDIVFPKAKSRTIKTLLR